MSLLDSFFDTKITDSRSKINYKTPSFNSKLAKSASKGLGKASKSLMKNSGNVLKNVYLFQIHINELNLIIILYFLGYR